MVRRGEVSIGLQGCAELPVLGEFPAVVHCHGEYLVFVVGKGGFNGAGDRLRFWFMNQSEAHEF